jgi:hypothetical protein
MSALPLRREQFKTAGFAAWLAQHGAEVGKPSNPYEVIRYRAYWLRPDRAETHIVYAKENGRLTFTGGSRAHYQRFLVGEPMMQAGEQFISKFDYHTPENDSPDAPKVGLSARRRARLIARDGTDCWFCGKAMGDDVTLEHLVPQSRGGGNDSANLVLAHASCNQTAANMSISEKVELRSQLRASGIETEGQDREDGLGAEHESPTATSGDAQS